MSELSPSGGSEGYGVCGDDEQIAKRENYVDYIANRPRVEKLGAHGLFNGSQQPLALSQVADEVAQHPSVVWLPIISLRREDAARLGYDNAQSWRSLLTQYAPQMAKAMKIPWEQFRWYAAFHDEGHHPHVHMVCYSADVRSGFLTKQGIADIKSMLAKEIFRQDLVAIYQKQTQRRDELVQDAGEVMERLVSEMQSGTLENQRIEQLMTGLAQRLRNCCGKKQYGYLSPAIKSLVDEVVEELAKDPRIATAYDLWYEQREEVLRTYKDDQPERIPLSQQKEFKRIKNIVIEEAVRLGELVPPDIQDQTEPVDEPTDEMTDEPADIPTADPVDGSVGGDTNEPIEDANSDPLPHAQWTKQYRVARQLLYGGEDSPPDYSAAFDLLLEEAATGNAMAMADLGKIYAEGLGREPDADQAREWYAKALVAFLATEKATPNHYVEYHIGWMFLYGVGTDKDEAAALPWLEKAAERGNPFAKYQLGKLLLCGESVPHDVDRAIDLLTQCAEDGNQFAQYTLGKACLLGQDIPRDQERALHWLGQSAGQGNEHAQYFLNRFRGSIFSSAASLLYHMGRIFQEQNQQPAAGGRIIVDSKLRQRIREKKIAMGHKPDDHEEQAMG